MKSFLRFDRAGKTRLTTSDQPPHRNINRTVASRGVHVPVCLNEQVLGREGQEDHLLQDCLWKHSLQVHVLFAVVVGF